jgi:hypothetical protein
LDDEVSGKIDDLEQKISGGLREMELRIAASENSLKMRVTQMEVAIMGAIKTGSGGGGGVGLSQGNIGIGGGAQRRVHLPARSGSSARLDSMEPSTSIDHELVRTGETVMLMEGLVEGDTEIRRVLHDLRRQARDSRRQTGDRFLLADPCVSRALLCGVAVPSCGQPAGELFGGHDDSGRSSRWLLCGGQLPRGPISWSAQ